VEKKTIHIAPSVAIASTGTRTSISTQNASVLDAVPAPQAEEDKTKPQRYGDGPDRGVIEDPQVELESEQGALN
jgi:hypothetical protein